jgi:hypothetical protein
MSVEKRAGGCLCGAVRYEATISGGFAACYCKMCQRWSAGTYFGVSTSEFELTQGEDSLAVYKSSAWAERAFCGTCGSNIYYFAPGHGGKSVALGSLDETAGLANSIQYFIDQQPEGISLVGETKTMTSEEIAKLFSELTEASQS